MNPVEARTIVLNTLIDNPIVPLEFLCYVCAQCDYSVFTQQPNATSNILQWLDDFVEGNEEKAVKTIEQFNKHNGFSVLVLKEQNNSATKIWHRGYSLFSGALCDTYKMVTGHSFAPLPLKFLYQWYLSEGHNHAIILPKSKEAI